MRISLKEFKAFIETIETYTEKEIEMCKFLHKYFMDGHSVVNFTSYYANALIKSMAISFANKTKDVECIEDDICYFIYECNFGKDVREISLIDKKSKIKKSWKIDSIKSFYKYIEEVYG